MLVTVYPFFFIIVSDCMDQCHFMTLNKLKTLIKTLSPYLKCTKFCILFSGVKFSASIQKNSH